MDERPAASEDSVEVADLSLGPGLPTLRIGSGPRKLVYLPGLTLHPGLPTGTERRLALSGWDALLGDYSLFRMGRRIRPVGTSFTDMADDVIAAIQDVGPPVDLMGASTGGVLAMHVAAARPDMVRRLVLVITGATLEHTGRTMAQRVIGAAHAGRWRAVYATILSIGVSGRFRRVAYRALGWALGPRLLGVPDDPTGLLAELDAWLRVDAGPLLGGISAPTLIIGGADDPVFPPTTTRSMADQLPNAVLAIQPKLAHTFPAQLTNDHIAPFLRAAPPST